MSNYWNQPEIILWTQLVLDSYGQFLGKSLIERTGNSREESEKLFFAPFIVLSHDTQPSPIFNYGNQAALDLWEIDWGTLIKTPSQQTVAPPDAEEAASRARMLEQVREQGFITHYEGTRVTAQGKLMKISDVTVWNIFDAERLYRGQAATYLKWWFL